MSLDFTGRSHLYKAYDQAYGEVFFRIAGLQEAFNDQLTILEEKINNGDNITDGDLQTFVTKIFDKCYNTPIEPKVKDTVQYLTNKLSYVNKDGQIELANCISKLRYKSFLSEEDKAEKAKLKNENPLLKKYTKKQILETAKAPTFHAAKLTPQTQITNHESSFLPALTNMSATLTEVAPRGEKSYSLKDCFMRIINTIVNLFKRLFSCCFKKEETK